MNIAERERERERERESFTVFRRSIPTLRRGVMSVYVTVAPEKGRNLVLLFKEHLK